MDDVFDFVLKNTESDRVWSNHETEQFWRWLNASPQAAEWREYASRCVTEALRTYPTLYDEELPHDLPKRVLRNRLVCSSSEDAFASFESTITGQTGRALRHVSFEEIANDLIGLVLAKDS